MGISLRNIYAVPDEWHFLYQLLLERPESARISHHDLPTYLAHLAFVESRPYRAWFFIQRDDLKLVGQIYLTWLNEIGVAITHSHQRHGYAEAAIKLLMQTEKPLPAKPGTRNGNFLANVAPTNYISQALFEKLGGRVIQHTYELPPRGEPHGKTVKSD